jgi:thiol-disulfide isomerase/thioredoxin
VSRWAGRILLAGLALLATLNVFYVSHHWKTLSKVTIPRGAEAPDFTGPLLAGGQFRLSESHGQPLALVFWASWCKPCRAELPGVERLSRRLASEPGHRVRVVAVNTEGDRDAAAEGVRELGLTMPVVLDDGSASSLYHVRSIPYTVLVGADGKVAHALRGVRSEDELWRELTALEKP